MRLAGGDPTQHGGQVFQTSGYWPSSQPSGAASSRACAAPTTPARTRPAWARLASSGPATFHTAASPSGRVNSDRSPTQHVVDAAARRAAAGRRSGSGVEREPHASAVSRSQLRSRARLATRRQVDGAVAAQVEAEHVAGLAARLGERAVRLAQDQADPLLAEGEPLAGAQQERDVAPPVVVDPQPGGDEGVGPGVLPHAVDVAEAVELAEHHLGRVDGPEAADDLLPRGLQVVGGRGSPAVPSRPRRRPGTGA